ncbi:MAG: S8 family serine peptidase, partial [bacterium]|nr:S8 family serine peptidase [bacterium]
DRCLKLAWQRGANVRSQLPSANALVVEMPSSRIVHLADEDAVQWIELPMPAFDEINDSNRARVGADTVQAPPYGLDGSGVTVLVYDGGFGLSSHVDFGGRHTARDPSGLSDHATHVAGTIGGDGTASSGQYRGMAPAVILESYGFDLVPPGPLQPGFLYTDPGDLVIDYTEAINTFGADISNNSIGSNTEPNGFDCTWQGDYGLTASLIDGIVRGSASGGVAFRIVWAAGNERQGSRCDVEGFGDYYSVAPPGAAKNFIAVGALNSNNDTMTSFSSWGPVDDGRLKPDISGPGCQSDGDFDVTSCSSSGGYTGKCGTSMSSPTVCGISALILEDYRAQYPGDPDFRNSTLKAFLAHTAVDLGNPGPDYQFGYGSVRVEPAIVLMRDENFLEDQISQGETANLLVIAGPGDSEVKVTLSWDDPPGTPNVNPNLVNDLDLKVFDGASTQYFPWTLDPLNPSAAAVRTVVDRRNNTEQVVIDTPAPGAYRIEVVGWNVPNGPQPFSITATPMLVACSPQGFLSLDRTKYACAATATLQVVDCDLNLDDAVIDTVDLTVFSDSEPGGELVTLSESGPQTAAFFGSVDLATTDGVGVVLVADGDTLTARYIDADDGMGGTNVVVDATAPIDCTGPVITNVQTINIEPRSATVTFDTNEPTTSQIHYGLSCGALTDTAQETGFHTAHSIDLTSLDDDTTYFYTVDTEDEAGNQTVDDNGGACHTFTTPEVPDFFTEDFTPGDNDLENFTILLVPNASIDEYALCGYTTVALPTDPTGGTPISLTDDGSQLINFGPDSVALYGVPYTGLFVNANGNVTFNAADSEFNETIDDHFAQPRISLLFDDFDPTAGGTISWKHEADRIAVTWQDVPEANASNLNTFQLEMYFDGRIQMTWLGLGASDGIAGLSEGLGTSPDFFETDLSGAGTCGPRPPSAQSKHVSVPEDGTAVIDLLAADDGLPAPPVLDYIITALPNEELKDAGTGQVITAGDLPYTLDGGGIQVIFTPAPGVSGPDSFQFKANDGGVPPDGGDSNIATISISIEPVLDPPFFDDFPTTTFDAFKWDVVANAGIDGSGLNPPSSPFSARFNGSPDGGDEIRTFMFDLAGYGGVQLEYAWQRTGGGEHPDTGDDLFIEYVDATGAWQVLNQHLGGGTDMTTFQAESLELPAEALHSSFRLRVRNTATSGAFDDWFVDDIRVFSLDTPEAFDGAATTSVNGFVDIALQADDPNGDPLNYVILSLPSDGLLSDPNGGMIAAVPHVLAAQGNTVRYTPTTGYNGPDGFTFETNDGSNTSNTANVGITVGGRQPVHSFSMDADPGWAVEGDWAFGVPTGGGSYAGDPSSGHTGSNVYGYNLAGDYPNGLATPMYLTTTALDLTELIGSELQFRRWLGVEVSVFDHANLEISTNGSTWAPLWVHDGDAINESAWSLQSFDISAVADGQPTVYFRWGMGPTDGSASYAGWNLDDVEVWGDVPITTVGIAGARSCRDHDGTEWCLDLTTNGIEPRVGPTTVEFDLTDTVTTVSAVVACQTNLYAGSVATALVDSDTVRLTMSPLPDEDCCTITLSGDAGDDFVVQTLAGDVNRTGRVNATDTNLTKGQTNK